MEGKNTKRRPVSPCDLDRIDVEHSMEKPGPCRVGNAIDRENAFAARIGLNGLDRFAGEEYHVVMAAWVGVGRFEQDLDAVDARPAIAGEKREHAAIKTQAKIRAVSAGGHPVAHRCRHGTPQTRKLALGVYESRP